MFQPMENFKVVF